MSGSVLRVGRGRWAGVETEDGGLSSSAYDLRCPNRETRSHSTVRTEADRLDSPGIHGLAGLG